MFRSKRKNSCSLGVLIIAGLLVLPGCPKKTEVTATPEAQAPAESQKEAVTQPATPEAQPAVTDESKERAAAAEGLKPVYFDFDQSFIRNDAKGVLKANAAWLKTHPTIKIKIEGNCDEKGTKEYNQALGQRRAAGAKRYLTDMGISGSRISIISYGKEKPVCMESTESCWQKNRRDDFIAND